jgi:spore coat protein CotH
VPIGSGLEPNPPDPYVDPTEAMFDPEHVLDVQITMAPEDWRALRLQTRSVLDVLGQSCLSPPERPFTYFPAEITVDGVSIPDPAVRKKGFFGSLDTEKPSLKLKFNEYVPGQRLNGLKRMTLNNNKSDRSHIKQCLGYQLLGAAGVPAPRCSFAKVAVNGRDLGIFTHVESIKTQFLRRHFAASDGNLYEGALSDFRTGWVDTFQKKTNELDPDRSDIEAIVPAATATDSQVVAALTPFFDLDAFTTFWAMELLIAHSDGYARNTNNFYLYHDPLTDKFVFIPWGIDAILNDYAGALPWEETPPPRIVWAEGILANRLYNQPAWRARYLDRLQALLDEVWDTPALGDEIDRMEAMLLPEIEASRQADFRDEVDRVRTFVRGRKAAVEALLAQAAPPWTQPLRDPWCADTIGTIAATFATTWGTAGAADPFSTGTGTLDVVIEGTALPAPDQVSATSGIDPDSGEHVIQVIALHAPNVIDVAHVVINDPTAPGVSLRVRSSPARRRRRPLFEKFARKPVSSFAR